MNTREQFQSSFNAVVKTRLKQAPNMPEEALFMLDENLSCAFFLSGLIEKNMNTRQIMDRLVNRMDKIRQAVEEARKKGGTPPRIEGDPETGEPPKLVNFTPKGKTRIIRP